LGHGYKKKWAIKGRRHKTSTNEASSEEKNDGGRSRIIKFIVAFIHDAT